MEALVLGGNRLTAEIPAAIGGLSSLEALHLEHNELTGSIPSEFGGLGRLWSLDLGYNRLTGEIPTEFESLAGLQHVFLSNNDLTGAIPQELGSLTNLKQLHLFDNAFMGSIPQELGNLTNLKELYLSNNDLTGGIPAQIGDLGSLERLSLDRNPLAGGLPLSLAALTELDIFYYYETDLCVPTDESFRAWLGTIDSHRGTGVDCATGQPDILEIIYNATDGPNWTNNTNWLTDAPLNEWHGVATDPAGWVTGLSLGGNRLSGGLPPELGDLATLEQLELHNNPLEGPLPLDLMDLSLKRFLYYNTNLCVPADGWFRGWLDSIEQHQGTGVACTDRQILEILYNATAGPNWTDDTNWITDAALDDWYGVSAHAAGANLVARVVLERNNLVGVLPPELGHLGHLTELTLFRNQLSGTIPPQLGRMHQLEDLGLSYNELSGAIPPELGNLPNLERLQLDNNRLSGSIPPELGNLTLNTTAGWVRLNNNQLSGPIPPELGNITDLGHLFLGNNQLSGAIPPELGNLSSLSQLHLSNNQLSGPIPASFANLTNLQLLWVSGNNVCVPRNDSAFMAWLEGLEGHDADGLPSCSDRGVLEALYDSTTGPNWTDNTNWKSDRPLDDWYGASATVADAVTEVHLRQNNLVGALPSELVHLADLAGLDLSNNQLSGTIPSELGGLAKLTNGNLSGNQLSGAIPAELGDLAKLVWLYLGRNDLTGAIPSELGGLTNLGVLGLNSNRLSGAIPRELGSLANLTELHLNDNQLSGAIPPELGGLTNLRILKLNNNQLSGAIPVEFVGLDRLESLRVAGNDVCVPRSDSAFVEWLEGVDDHDTDALPSCSAGFRDDFDSGASLADWTIHNADADVGAGVLRLTNRVEDRLGIAERRAPPTLAGWTIAARMGRAAREASPGVLWFTGHDRFAAVRFALATRDSTNYESALFDAEADRWVSVTNMSGHSEAVMEDATAFTDITLGSEGDDFVVYADNDSRDEAAVLFRFDMDETTLDGVALREFLHELTGVWLINSGPVDLTSLHDWVEVSGTATGAASAAAVAARSGIDSAWAADVSGVHRTRVEGRRGGRGREPR